MEEKELIESRNAKVEAMENIVNLAKSENRVITDEEKTNFENLEKEIASIDNTIAIQERVNKMGMKEVKEPVVETVENKEVKMFENQIRGIINADTPTTKADGQVTIGTTIANKIIDEVVAICPVFQMAERYNVKGNLVLPKYDKTNSSIAMTYADEGTSAESGNVKFAKIELNGFLGRCLAKVSKSLINNSQFDIVDFVIKKMAQAISVFIEKELLSGTEGKVEGLSGITEDMTVTATGEVTADNLIDLQDKVVDNYQANSIFIMSRETRNSIRKLKDADKNFVLNRDLTAKWGYTLLGKDVYCSDNAGNNIFYGDLSGLATKVSEDINMQVLTEKYAEEHMTGILAFVELDAKVQDTQKLAKLTIA
jgi:HK97 family phage major capsid protein